MSDNQHWDRCVASTEHFADGLRRVNEGAREGIIRSFLEAPAFYPEWRGYLLQIALDRLSERPVAVPGTQID